MPGRGRAGLREAFHHVVHGFAPLATFWRLLRGPASNSGLRYVFRPYSRAGLCSFHLINPVATLWRTLRGLGGGGLLASRFLQTGRPDGAGRDVVVAVSEKRRGRVCGSENSLGNDSLLRVVGTGCPQWAYGFGSRRRPEQNQGFPAYQVFRRSLKLVLTVFRYGSILDGI